MANKKFGANILRSRNSIEPERPTFIGSMFVFPSSFAFSLFLLASQ